ncbi:nuclear pore protein 84/107 containing protein [Klebsormidium nitens]|uniref:Nuclear pore complex protein n=1 Tax=Klebsormidium nitens TaxID=105231 RepID=A0A1Y1IEG8_KLENI|nr:nuclear pore protein 84/107 containing protein [Klebsormidium nitens]|eukprot:GAQ87116.1 nuclear pore protein 84/107 containing protein [Klebsormidium nitens]
MSVSPEPERAREFRAGDSVVPFEGWRGADGGQRTPGNAAPWHGDDHKEAPSQQGTARKTSSEVAVVRHRDGAQHQSSRNASKHRVRSDNAPEAYAALLRPALRGDAEFASVLGGLHDLAQDLADRRGEMAAAQTRSIERHLLEHKSRVLQSEAATWSLVWHLLGKPLQEMLSAGLLPPTSQQEACEYALQDARAQACMRVVQWLEDLAGQQVDRDEKRHGGYAGLLRHSQGVWVRTAQALKSSQRPPSNLVSHVDPDAPTRENLRLHPQDSEDEELLMRGVWTLLKAGRLSDARQLCRDVGQAWRAASLGGTGDAGPVPSVEGFRGLTGTKRAREEQAAEIEAGRGRQRRLWKWTCFLASEKVGGEGGESKYEAAVYGALSANTSKMLPVCDTWEAACWALFRGWLDSQVDSALADAHAAEGLTGPSPSPDELSGSQEKRSAIAEAYKNSSAAGGWPAPVLAQQPQSFPEVFERLQTSPQLPDSVQRAGKDQQRMIQTLIILHRWGELVDCLKHWVVTPTAETGRPRSQPEFIRFAAHLVLALRKVLPPDEDLFQEDLQRTCNVIINMYAVQLVAEQQEHLVALYAAQLVAFARVDLYANLLDMKQGAGLEVKQRIFEGALQELDFSGEGSVCQILDRVLVESRADQDPPEGVPAAEHLSLEAFRRTRAMDWLFLPVPVQWAECRPELTAKALLHGNIILRELALASAQDWSPAAPGTARAAAGLLEHLSDAALSPTEELAAVRMVDADTLEAALLEKREWERYFRCDGLLRRWALLDEANRRIGAGQLTPEEAHEARQLAEQAIQGVQEILDGWLSEAELDAPSPVGVTSEEVEMTAALVGKDGKLEPAGRAECSAVHDAIMALVEEGAAEGNDIQVNVNPLPGNTGLLKLRASRDVSEHGDADGAVLVRLLAAAVSGGLPPPAHQLLLRPSRIDARFLFGGDVGPVEAPPLLRSLCRHCCIPSLALRAMHARIYLAGFEGFRIDEAATDVVQVIATRGAAELFAQEQLQEILHLEREATLRSMDRKERFSQRE